MASCDFSKISEISLLVAVGSVDGMAGAAACLRQCVDPDKVELVFTQAFQVDQVDVSKWPSKSKVGIIDLGVNNQGPTPNRQLTVDFIHRIKAAAHQICFIADEHGKEAWDEVLKECEVSREDLLIAPEDRGEVFGSSCAILSRHLGEFVDGHTKALLEAGNQADQGNFDTDLVRIFNRAIKSNMFDPLRRPYLVRCLAKQIGPDEKIQAWMREYDEMEANLPLILTAGTQLSDKVFLYDGSALPHDATTLFIEAYKKSPIVVLIDKSHASIGTNIKGLNILKILQDAHLSARGAPFKATINKADLEAAIEIVKNTTI